MMNKRKVLVSAILAIALCVSLISGATFALFTSKSEVNIAVTSGKVAVTAIVDGDLALSHQEADSAEASGYKTVEGSLYSGTATLDADTQTITIDKMVPMDKISFNIKVTNESNVKIQYRTVIKAVEDDGLFAGLKIKVGEQEFNDTIVKTAYAQYAVGEGNQTIAVSIELPQDAGNDYQGKTCKLQYAVEATQGNAKIVEYPDEVSVNTFPESVENTTWTGAASTAPATAAYVDEEGSVKYVADVTDAIEAGASTVYLKENATVNLNLSSQTNRTIDLTHDLTIYANGADFQKGQISMNMTAEGKAASITVKIYDAKNIYVWGGTPNDGVTQTVIFENCHNEGESAIDQNSRMFYVTGNTGTIDVTLRNCSVSKAEAPVYMKNNGSVTLENCSFSECAAAIKISHKATGTCNVNIANTTFDKCGWTTEVSGQAYLTEDSSSIKCKTNGTMTLTLNNVTITNVVGNNSILLDDDADYTGTTTVNATDVTVNGEAWSNN